MRRPTSGGERVAKRLPRPANPVRSRCELDQGELRAVEDAAHACRLSVASYIRVALVDAAAHVAERQEAWNAIAAELMKGTGTEPPKRPGRPRKKPKGDK